MKVSRGLSYITFTGIEFHFFNTTKEEVKKNLSDLTLRKAT